MANNIPTQAQLEASRATVQATNADLERLKAQAIAKNLPGTAAEYQQMIDQNNIKINNYTANINNYTSYFQTETEQKNYEKWVDGNPTGTEQQPLVDNVTTTTVTTNPAGGSYTVNRAQDIATPQSQTLQAESKQLQKQAELYNLNPDSPFGQRALQQKLANGEITQAQYDEIRSLTPDQRLDKAADLYNQAIAKDSEAQAAKIPGQTTVTYDVTPTTTATTTTVVSDGQTSSTTVTDTEPIVGNAAQDIPTDENINSQIDIDPNEDPFEQQRIEAEQQVNRDELIREEQPETISELDPFEQQRLEAEQRLNEESQVQNEFPAPVGEEDPFEQQRLEAEQELNRTELQREEGVGAGSDTNVQGALENTRSTATEQDAQSFNKRPDWRVRLSLAPGAKYLYKGIPKSEAGILAPLQETDGVIFPYTPSVNINYVANYDPTDLIHSNYKVYQYKNSAVDTVQITGDFTAQDSKEANYLLAVIHFFKSVTKMFYGKDENPRNGTPPPLCYLSGLGTFQFDNHPLVITNFSYQLPTDVDYIRASSVTSLPGTSTSAWSTTVLTNNASSTRLQGAGLTAKTPNFQNQNFNINSEATYIPTKMQISITALPVVSRNDISNTFSLKRYATGTLLQGSKRNGGGIW